MTGDTRAIRNLSGCLPWYQEVGRYADADLEAQTKSGRNHRPEIAEHSSDTAPAGKHGARENLSS